MQVKFKNNVGNILSCFNGDNIVSAGASDNVKYNLPVIDADGLVGRILHVGQWSSRVLLVTDLNSRIPVRLERTGDLAIAEGQNEAFLRLRFLPEEAQIVVGDRILTSGHGGVFPPDIPVARVSEIDNEYVYLEPVGLLEKLNYVRIIDYSAVPDEAELQKNIEEGNNE